MDSREDKNIRQIENHGTSLLYQIDSGLNHPSASTFYYINTVKKSRNNSGFKTLKK